MRPVAWSVITTNTVLFALGWWFLSASHHAFHRWSGLLVAVLLAWRFQPLRRAAAAPWLRWALYLPWLLWAIVRSSLHVSRLVLSPRARLHPRLVEYHTDLATVGERVILSQSITLTPGTITVQLDDERRALRVHALDAPSSEELVSGRLERRIARLSGAPPGAST